MMELRLQERARKMVKGLPDNCGFVFYSDTVVIRCIDAPYVDTPTPYDEIDLKNAIELGLVEKRNLTVGSVTGSTRCDWYSLPQTRD